MPKWMIEQERKNCKKDCHYNVKKEGCKYHSWSQDRTIVTDTLENPLQCD